MLSPSSLTYKTGITKAFKNDLSKYPCQLGLAFLGLICVFEHCCWVNVGAASQKVDQHLGTVSVFLDHMRNNGAIKCSVNIKYIFDNYHDYVSFFFNIILSVGACVIIFFNSLYFLIFIGCEKL